MKKIIKSLIVIMATVSLSSCNLDLAPSSSISRDVAFETFKDAENFSRGMALYFKISLYGNALSLPEFQSDLFNASMSYGNRFGTIHRMDNSLSSTSLDFENEWKLRYSALLENNIFLENIHKIEGKNETENNKIKEYTAHAHFYRAYIYHLLMSRFAEEYDPAKASTALGVPLELASDRVNHPRSTMEEIYIQINKDITAAKELFESIPGNIEGTKNAIYPTLDAVKALGMRVKFSMRDFEGAAALAEELIGLGRYSLAQSVADMENEWVNDNGPETIMQMYASDIKAEADNTRVNNNYLGYSSASKKYVPDFIPTQEIVDKYDVNDYRFQVWFKKLPCVMSATDVDLILFHKYPGNPAYPGSAGRNYLHSPKVFRLGEAYLIAAESYMMKSAPEPGKALAKINELLVARNATTLASVTMEDIQTEWAKETIGEGFRISCWKRWGRDVTGGETLTPSWIYPRTPQDENTIMIGERFDKIKLYAKDYHYTWPIPSRDIKIHGNLVQNPGWEDM